MSKGRLSRRLAAIASWWRRPPADIAPSPCSVVHTENKLRLLRYHPRAAGLAYKTPILLVPSLINRWYVLDLAPGKSMVQWLVAQGHDVWCIDWGTPGPEDRHLDLEDFAGRYLGRCARLAAGSSPRGAVHLLGYCMGGIFTAAYTSVQPRFVASLVALAAPVRFGDDSLLTLWTRDPNFDPSLLAEATGNVPWQLLQGSFNLLRPTLPLTNLVGVVDRADDAAFIDGFVALETWANDNVSVPGAFYRTYIDRIYRRDGLLGGQVSLLGRPVDVRNITVPTFTIAFAQDTIAPQENCAALHDLVAAGDKALHIGKGSHVGSVVSRKAAVGLWPAIAQWCVDRDG